MPNIKSAMKRVKVSKTKNLRNRMVKSGVKTAVKKYQAALWAQHGLFVSGPDFDTAFGLAHTIEKSAEIYWKVLASGQPILQTITDDALRAIAKDFHVELNEEFLD